MAARTLLQQAVPTTFGFKAAGWLVGLVETRARLAAVAASLPAQLGGAAGTLAALGDDGPEVLRALRRRARPARAGRPVAHDQDAARRARPARSPAPRARPRRSALDVDAARADRGRRGRRGRGGGSSTMPHKRNPVGAVLAVACARHARANAGILLESVVQEHERAVGAWHAEWHALATALAATGGAAAPCGARSPGSRSTRPGCGRTSLAETLAEAAAARCRGDASGGLSRLGRARSSTARSRCTADERHRRPLRLARLGVLDLGSAAAGARAARGVVRIDHPGHGGAPVVAFTDIAELASARARRRVRTAPSRFVGLSLGGAVGMQLALTAPERVERLVLACTAARFGEPEQWLERAAVVRAAGAGCDRGRRARTLVHARVRRASRRTARRCSRSTRRATRAVAKRSRAGTSATSSADVPSRRS